MDVPIEISLPCGRITLVSREDFQRVSRIAWSFHGRYAHGRWKKRDGGDGKTVLMHRFILSPPAGMVVDHIDGNGLNNTRENLQITTQSRNCMRGFRGNVWMKQNGRWMARMRIDGRMTYLGMHASETEAREAIDAIREIAWTDPNINLFGTTP